MTADLAAPPSSSIGHAPDISQVERWISVGLGGVMVGLCLKRAGPLAYVVGLLGTALIARGVTRIDPITRVLRPSAAERAIARERGWSSAALVTGSITVARPPAQLYQFWRDFSNLPRFFEGVSRIDMIDGQRSWWRLAGPGGADIAWEGVVVRDEVDRRIGWESEEGGDIRNAGTVTFRESPDGRGTEVSLELVYEPPAGPLGRGVVAMFRQKPQLQVPEALRRFKALMEAS